MNFRDATPEQMTIEEEIGQKSFKSSAHKAIVNLIFTSHWMSAHQSQVFKKFGVSMQQFNVLRILKGQHPKPATIKLIQERMLDRMSNASRLVDKLKQKGLIDRQECPEDRRQVDVIINEQGVELLEELNKELDIFIDLFMPLSEEELKAFNGMLDKIRG